MNIFRLFGFFENHLVLSEVELLETIENPLNATLGIGVKVRHAFIKKFFYVLIFSAKGMHSLHEFIIWHIKQLRVSICCLNLQWFVLIFVDISTFHATFPHLPCGYHGRIQVLEILIIILNSHTVQIFIRNCCHLLHQNSCLSFLKASYLPRTLVIKFCIIVLSLDCSFINLLSLIQILVVSFFLALYVWHILCFAQFKDFEYEVASSLDQKIKA